MLLTNQYINIHIAEPFKLFGGDGDTGADDSNEPLFGNMLGMNDDFNNESEAPSFTPKQNKEVN